MSRLRQTIYDTSIYCTNCLDYMQMRKDHISQKKKWEVYSTIQMSNAAQSPARTIPVLLLFTYDSCEEFHQYANTKE